MKNLGSKRLETDRLILKSQTMEEQKYLWSILMIPDVNRYYLTVPTYLRDKLKDWNIQKQYYEEDMKHANDLDVYRWSIFLKDTNECIGRVSCHKAKFEDETMNDSSIRGVGWYINPKYQGLGYGKEAAKAMIDFMFSQVGINAIKSGACVNNPASWKIYEGLGFKRLDKTKMVQYTYLDELSEAYDYILTKEMYENQKKIEVIVVEINELCKLNNLGEVLSIEPITGGLMHVMYKVETTNGCYAIKKLNNKIMDTQDKIDDYNESERIANFVNNHGIKASCALKTSNGYVSDINGNKYVIYKYSNGKVLDDDDITVDHCSKIGDLIARLHLLDYHKLGYEEKLFKFTRPISFEEFVVDPKMDNMIYKDELLNRYKDYQEIYNKANECYNNVTTYFTLCHYDIFQPNVLWENDEPLLIDFETVTMGSPLRELACTAIHFSGFDSNQFDENKYKAVIKAYSKKININTDDYESIVYSELIWKIGWLRHCVQRSLGIKAINEQEIINDTKEVPKMIDQIDRYITLIPRLSNLFNEVLNSKKVL